jgi:NAD(P)-dependent dehydrogenase (short-subunit alcohol dehydrogenase family)
MPGSMGVMFHYSIVSNILEINRTLTDSLPVSDEVFDQLININLKGVLYCYRAAAAQMIKQGREGRIIGACSGSGLRGEFRFSNV